MKYKLKGNILIFITLVCKNIHRVNFLRIDNMIVLKPYALQNSEYNRTRTCDLSEIKCYRPAGHTVTLLLS